MHCFFCNYIIYAIPAISQQIYREHVHDSNTNLPLEGATVTLLPSKISTITNASGKFIFKKNLSADTSVLISEIGYANQIFSVDDIRKNACTKASAKKNCAGRCNGCCKCRRSL